MGGFGLGDHGMWWGLVGVGLALWRTSTIHQKSVGGLGGGWVGVGLGAVAHIYDTSKKYGGIR